METARPSQLPSWLLLTVMCMLGICTLPAALFFVLSGISGDSGPSPFLVLGLGVPALVAYPVAVWLWSRARRVRSTGRAWLLAALGLLLVVGTSTLPVALLGGAFVGEWQETQPGGRGYQPPNGSR
jgi:hypothetical protein